MPDEFLRALLDPTAPLPSGWPTGAWGAFCLFLLPVGGGIPAGVLMANAAGVSPVVTAFLYFLSDVVLACTTEPFLLFARWLGRRVPALGAIGQRLSRLTDRSGLRENGVRGPLGLILVSFTVSPTTGRAAAAAAGHGFLSGWTFAITGDMLYFLVLMASTLWLSSVVGDERVTVGVVLLGMWLAPSLLRRLTGRVQRASAAQPPSGTLALAPAGPPPAEPSAPSPQLPSIAPAASAHRPRSRQARRSRRR